MAEATNYWAMWVGVTNDPYLYVDLVKDLNQVAIGYVYASGSEEADLSFLTEDLEENELRERFDSLCRRLGKSAYLGKRPGGIFNYFLRFVRDMKAGDIVLVPSTRKSIMSCEIVGNYFYVRNPGDGCEFEHRRKIRLIGELNNEKLAPDLVQQTRRRPALRRMTRAE